MPGSSKVAAPHAGVNRVGVANPDEDERLAVSLKPETPTS